MASVESKVEFRLPDLGEGIHEAEIISIKVKEGDRVEEDQPLFEVETDKAVVEIPSPYAGIITKIHVKEGQTVTTGSVMVTYDTGGGEGKKSGGEEKASKKEVESSAKAQSETGAAAKAAGGKGGFTAPPAEPDRSAASKHAPSGNGKSPAKTASHDPNLPVPAAPAVRQLARELGIDLYEVAGSGPGGRVLKEDVRSHAAGALESSMKASSRSHDVKGDTRSKHETKEEGKQASLSEKYGDAKASKEKFDAAPMVSQPSELPDFSRFGAVERIPLRSIRRKIAMNMMQSWTHIPHVTHFDEADVTGLVKLQAKHDKKFMELTGGARLTMTVFAVKAVVSALKKYPQFNASLDEATGEIVFKHYYNIGVAVATERGLIVPVIHNADQKSLFEIAQDLADIATKARSGKIELDRLQGGTFTITNIGAIGGTSMVPMINYPEAAILGMARGAEKPVVRDGKIEIATILPLALSFDHRLADGAEAAYFVKHVIERMEDLFHYIIEE